MEVAVVKRLTTDLGFATQVAMCFRRLVVVTLTLFVSNIFAADAPPSEEQTLKWLRELKSLPKVHYSWPLPLRQVPDAVLVEYCRITHAISISGEWSQTRDIERAVTLCKMVNTRSPKIPATIGVNFSVWHRRFGKDLPPTDTGPTHWGELAHLRRRLDWIRETLAGVNRKYQANVSVSALLLDSERFHTKTNDVTWNEAMTAKYDAAHEIIKELFPNVRVDWYARGAVHP